MARKFPILILVFFLIIFIVNAVPNIERVTLKEGESTLFINKNITLMKASEKKVVVCVNNIKGIIEEDKFNTVNGIGVEVKDVQNKEADLKFVYECRGCVCDDSCNNIRCFDECLSNKDCDDKNINTKDRCIGIPTKCVYTTIKEEVQPNKTITKPIVVKEAIEEDTNKIRDITGEVVKESLLEDKLLKISGVLFVLFFLVLIFIAIKAKRLAR